MKKEEKLSVTKEKLLQAASALMEEAKDSSEVTSRALAERAGVQLAMINYCFGSREALLFEAFRAERSKYENDDMFKSFFNDKKPPKERIRNLYYGVVDYLVHQYKFTKAVTGHVLLHRDLTEGLGSYPLVAEHYKGKKEDWEIKFISYQLSSMMQLVMYRIEDMSAFLGKDLNQKEELRSLVDREIDLLLVD